VIKIMPTRCTPAVPATCLSLRWQKCVSAITPINLTDPPTGINSAVGWNFYLQPMLFCRLGEGYGPHFTVRYHPAMKKAACVPTSDPLPAQL